MAFRVFILAVISFWLISQANAEDQLAIRNILGDSLLLGTAMDASMLDNPRVVEIAGRQFNAITPENDLKPLSVQPIKGEFHFKAGDRLVEFAQKNKMQLIGHTLCWHQQAPKWMFEDASGKPLGRREALENLRTHIFTVMSHFKGKIRSWDVVNEAIDDGDGYLRDTPARRAIGDDFVVKAFQFAHEADPDVQLMYNDYMIELPKKRAQTLKLIRELKSAGVRLDAVGIQGHWGLDWPDMKVVEESIQAYAAEGLKISITELDFDVLPRATQGADLSQVEKSGADPYRAGCPDSVLAEQAKRYEAIFKLVLKYRNVIERVTLWGIYDGSTWLNHYPVSGRTNHPLLFDRSFKPKPAFDAVVRVLESK